MSKSIYQRKPIPDFPGYEVDTEGNVFSMRYGRERLLKFGTQSPMGYLSVRLFHEGTGRTMRVNRLVAITFIPNPDNKPYVLHSNDLPTDNKADNLRWGTHQENMTDKSSKHRAPYGEYHHNSKLSTKDIEEIRTPKYRYGLNRELARKYNVWPSTISKIRKGEIRTNG